MIQCKKCGNEEKGPEEWREGNIRSIMEELEVCFNCAFWIEKIRLHDDQTFIIKGERYHCAGPSVKGENGLIWRGHGGSKFQIKKFGSDRIYKTDNLWFQGIIPDIFKDEIPDNAEFVKDEPLKITL